MRQRGDSKPVNRKSLLARSAAALLALTLAAGCSAIESDRQRAVEQPAAATAIAATVAYEVSAIAQRSTVTATESVPSATAPAAAATAPPPFDITAADSSVFGTLPLDSERLRIIAALAFEADGSLLAATRAGEIYRLRDADRDDRAELIELVFADEAGQLAPVLGLMAQGEALLLLLHGGRLSQLRADGDGGYSFESHLSAGELFEPSPLQASNGIMRAPDGRLFSADVSRGQIVRVHLRG